MIKLERYNDTIIPEFFTFSGGERNVKIPKVDYKDSPVWFTAHITSSDGIMDLLLLKDAVDNHDSMRSSDKRLVIPYLPYARQDRVMVEGEALSVRVMADLINSMGFDSVLVNDPHSDVGPALIKNLHVKPVEEEAISLLVRNDHFMRVPKDDLVICSPDAGALKKVSKVAKNMNIEEMVIGIKHRNVATGQITGTGFMGADVKGRTVLMVDDIADGGATFIHLGKALKDAGAKSVLLYVTHGIFSKGMEVFDGVIDAVYTPFPWKKYVEGNDPKGLIKSLDQTGYFG
ncbi:ribose-phosphate pyrophosphokinase [Serratia phage vB_SmaM-ChuuTotoro]|nr:ribose-phosphate pyrophosphokinase [Serratia phage vB_SmaM-ChuuTotoro]